LELFACHFISKSELPDIALLQNRNSKQISTQAFMTPHTPFYASATKPTNKLARYARLKKGMNPEWVHERPFLAQPSLQKKSDERKLAQAPHIHTGTLQHDMHYAKSH
jgi:hypothetical protein